MTIMRVYASGVLKRKRAQTTGYALVTAYQNFKFPSMSNREYNAYNDLNEVADAVDQYITNFVTVAPYSEGLQGKGEIRFIVEDLTTQRTIGETWAPAGGDADLNALFKWGQGYANSLRSDAQQQPAATPEQQPAQDQSQQQPSNYFGDDFTGSRRRKRAQDNFQQYALEGKQLLDGQFVSKYQQGDRSVVNEVRDLAYKGASEAQQVGNDEMLQLFNGIEYYMQELLKPEGEELDPQTIEMNYNAAVDLFGRIEGLQQGQPATPAY